MRKAGWALRQTKFKNEAYAGWDSGQWFPCSPHTEVQRPIYPSVSLCSYVTTMGHIAGMRDECVCCTKLLGLCRCFLPQSNLPYPKTNKYSSGLPSYDLCRISKKFFLYCCFKTLSFHFVFINSNELRVFHVISGSLLISPARISSFCRQGLGSSQLYVLHRLWYSAFLNVSDIICFEVLYGNGRCLINYN